MRFSKNNFLKQIFLVSIPFISISVHAQNVGIGTTNPAFKLDIQNGSINTDSVYRIGTITVLSVLGTNNLFTGQHAGKNNSGIENTFSGAFSGRFNTTGYLNSFYGTGAGYNNIGGFYNSFFGAETGFSNTEGKDNSFFGMQAGSTNSTGSSNSFFGRSAGALNSTGKSNSFFGMSAGYSNNTGNNNSFYGDSTGFKNTTGTDNTFMGKWAGYYNTIGNSNSFFGKSAGLVNSTGYSNSFFGQTAGIENSSGFENSIFGFYSGPVNSTGFENSFFGSNAGFQNLSGSKNSFFGKYAGYGNTSGTNNTSLGYSAFFNSGALNNATSIGSNARVDCSNCLVLGSVIGINGASASVNVGVGTTNPQFSAALDVSSETKGFLPPRMTKANRDAITTPAIGLIIWCSNCGVYGQINVYNGIHWTNMMGGAPLGILAIGDSDGGGIVAYILQPGDPGFVMGETHGLIVPPGNQGTVEWGCLGTLIGGTSSDIGTGQPNTNNILSGCGTPNIAAHKCATLILNGYDDWYLPSKDELNKLYLNRIAIGGFVSDFYFSSSEFDINSAWSQTFSGGGQDNVTKSSPTYVRAVRAF